MSASVTAAPSSTHVATAALATPVPVPRSIHRRRTPEPLALASMSVRVVYGATNAARTRRTWRAKQSHLAYVCVCVCVCERVCV